MYKRSKIHLRTILSSGILVSVGVLLALSAAVLVILNYNYTRAERNLAALVWFDSLLEASASFNQEQPLLSKFLTADEERLGASLSALEDARQKTDQLLEKVSDQLDTLGVLDADLSFWRAIEDVHSKIRETRKMQREFAEAQLVSEKGKCISEILHRSFSVDDDVRGLELLAIGRMSVLDPDLAGQMLLLANFNDLRNYASRIGAEVLPFAAMTMPMPDAAFADLERDSTRLADIWQLVKQQDVLFNSNTELMNLRQSVQTILFDGLPELKKGIVENGRMNGGSGFTIDVLGSKFLPTIPQVGYFKSAFYDAEIARLKAKCLNAFVLLVAIGTATATIVVVTGGLMYALRRHIFTPLLLASKNIIALAKGDLLTQTQCNSSSAEIRELYEALDDLRQILGERQHYTEDLRVRSETDALTGLWSRSVLDRIGAGQAEFDELPSDVSLIMMDLDRFKSINDTYGHQAGDTVLRQAARRLLQTMGDNAIIVRFGGEEFAIILHEADQQTALIAAERTRVVLSSIPFEIEDEQTITVTASFGVSVGRRDGDHWRWLLKAADDALYQAKANGRNRVCYNAGFRGALDKRASRPS